MRNITPYSPIKNTNDNNLQRIIINKKNYKIKGIRLIKKDIGILPKNL
jgi:hypothetical protein